MTLDHSLYHIVQLFSHDESNIHKHHSDEENGKSELHGEGLEVDLDEADPGIPIEGLPGITHLKLAGPANNLWDDFSTIGTIEWDDGFFLFGEK